jgi:hypothetical protein
MGRDMKTSHKGLGITENDWQATIKYMCDSMTELNRIVKITGAEAGGLFLATE